MRLAAVLLTSAAVFGASVADVRRGFENPPDAARIMMRWWWFGPGVTKAEIEREMRAMKQGGMGGFEVQAVYPLWLDDAEHNFRNLPFGSEEFQQMLGFTAQKAKELGLRMDVTLGSGWPFGGPHIPVTQAAGRLRVDRIPVQANDKYVAVPSMEAGEDLLAVFLARGDKKQFSADGIVRLDKFADRKVMLPARADGPHVALFFISGRTGMQVKRAAVNAEGFVLDHYDRSAIDAHLKAVGERLLKPLGGNPPYAVFSDSLEVFGSDWTPQLLAEFRKRRGYDLTPYLPALIGDIGPKTADIRYDWATTLAELCEERYLKPLTEWAHQHKTLFRSQTYGTPPVLMSSSSLVDLPEGEGPQWRSFSSTRWATSASHAYGRPVSSSETWTWLHSPSFRATPLDMKAEADLHFLQGVNQLIGHGWPYSPELAGRPGWRFYAAAVLNDDNPWWIVMPDVTRYLQRVSYALRQGEPANDIAIYLPSADVQAQFTAGHVSIDRAMEAQLGPELIPQVLGAGYNFDFIDDRAIAERGVGHPILILPAVERMPLATLQRLQAFQQKGGIVIATKRLPAAAPGMQAAERDSTAVRELAAKLLTLQDEKTLGSRLTKALPPDFATGVPEIGFIHRKLQDGELYFVANTGNKPARATAKVRITGLNAHAWDPYTGKAVPGALALDLAPYESRVIVFSKDAAIPAAPKSGTGTVEVTGAWKVTFANGTAVMMERLRSWTEAEATRFYSGTATYETTVDVPAGMEASKRVVLSLGQGTALPLPGPSNKPGIRAWIESPVAEAAAVFVNGKQAGSVWRPPYEADVTGFLKPGRNDLRIVVANTAINAIAGKPLPDYRLLNVRYGERFQPQDLNNLQPVRSGLFGPVRLESR